jgi:hypothetical protein
MKKLSEKIVSIALAVVGALLMSLLLAAMFGAVGTDEFDNKIVKILIITFSVIFCVLAAVEIASAFSDSDRLNAILLFKDEKSATKATVGVVKKLTYKAAKLMENVKITRIILNTDDHNDLKMRICVKIKGNDTKAVIERLRALVSDELESVIGVVFDTVDFKITKIKSDYRADDKKIDERISKARSESEQKTEVTEKAELLTEETERQNHTDAQNEVAENAETLTEEDGQENAADAQNEINENAEPQKEADEEKIEGAELLNGENERQNPTETQSEVKTESAEMLIEKDGVKTPAETRNEGENEAGAITPEPEITDVAAEEKATENSEAAVITDGEKKEER